MVTFAAAPALEFKSKSVNMASIHVHSSNLVKLKSDLKQKIEQSPMLFKNAPVILDFGNIEDCLFDVNELLKLCHQLAIYPVAIQNATEELQIKFLNIGIPRLNSNTTKKENISEKVITTSVRSGQQLYFDCPVTIIGDVKAGAEILSDYSIHIYGTLYGKAMAGIQSNDNAQIFMQACQAELISIGKRYLIAQDHQQLIYNYQIRIKSFNGELKVMKL
ncbi:MAG: septum site-determining protein MinC [Legionellales bacterium]|nr:septum site-determining protein MinC [Legionellales bacterium]OUX67277.1 MAG: septum site-determining protein MinC [bacterium TMED178]|tara:strand:- start:9477 stop:10133 length:657 start_codon:yes stop_codon:yes gene_type:complete